MAKENKAAAAIVPLKLQAKTVFLAGNFYHQNEAITKLVKLEAGKTVDELTGKTDFMILGYSGVANPQKKAAKLNAQGAAIQVLSVDQFLQHIRPTPDEAVQLLLTGPKGIERWNCHCGDANHYYGALARAGQAAKTAYLRGADFSHADLANANLGELVDHCDFTGANLSGCQLYLSHCQLGGAKLDGVFSLTLVACEAENVNFTRVAAGNIHIESSNLDGSRFAGLAQRHLNFGKCQLNGADFSGIQATHSTFLACSLRKARLTGANLEQTDFTRSDLTGADFTNANLTLAKFSAAKVDEADFTGATLHGADVVHVDFSKARGFDPARVKPTGGPHLQALDKITATCMRFETSAVVHDKAGTHTVSVDSWSWTSLGGISGRMLRCAHLHPGATIEADSIRATFSGLAIPRKEAVQLVIRGWHEAFGVEAPSDEDLKKAAVSTKAEKKAKADELLGLLRTGKKGVAQWNENSAAQSRMLDKISGIDLANAKLAGVKIQNIEWKHANLSGADLAKAQLTSCRFPEGNLAAASLKGAQVHGAVLHGANLENVDATSADLRAASMKRANCKGANFAKAQLSHADLCGADLTGADLSGADLTGVSYDEKTRWPKGFTPTLEMTWKGPGTSPAAHKLVQSTKPKGKLDIEQFMKRLEELTDAAKLSKALAMLKADRFRLYAQVNSDHFVGVVKSQTSADLVYSCRLNADGTYACCTQNLNICGGLRGSLCKHLLVLIVGLAKNGELDTNLIDTWIRLSKTNKPALDKDAMSETFLRYKGAEAGEVDWRPTETIPEDYYAM